MRSRQGAVKNNPGLLSQAQYARHAGISSARVCTLVKEGVIKTTGGRKGTRGGKSAMIGAKIDPVAADAARAGATDPTMIPPRKGGKPRKDGSPPSPPKARTPTAVKSVGPQPADPPGQDPAADPVGELSIFDHKTMKAKYEALAAKHAHEITQDEHVMVSVAEEVFMASMAIIAQGMESLAGRLARELAEESNPAETRKIIMGETRKIRESASAKIRELRNEE